MRLKGPIIKPRPVTSAEFADRLYELRRPLILGVLALLVLVFAWLGYRTVKANREEAAQAILTTAAQLLETAPEALQPSKTTAPETPDPQEQALALFDRISVEYPSSRAAEHAILQMGNILFELGRYQEALAAYQRYLEQYPHGSAVFLAGLGRAYAMEAQGLYREAASIFQSLADRHRGHALTIEALMGLGRSLTLAEETAKATEVYRRVVKEYAATGWARRAEEQLALLGR